MSNLMLRVMDQAPPRGSGIPRPLAGVKKPNSERNASILAIVSTDVVDLLPPAPTGEVAALPVAKGQTSGVIRRRSGVLAGKLVGKNTPRFRRLNAQAAALAVPAAAAGNDVKHRRSIAPKASTAALPTVAVRAKPVTLDTTRGEPAPAGSIATRLSRTRAGAVERAAGGHDPVQRCQTELGGRGRATREAMNKTRVLEGITEGEVDIFRDEAERLQMELEEAKKRIADLEQKIIERTLSLVEKASSLDRIQGEKDELAQKVQSYEEQLKQITSSLVHRNINPITLQDVHIDEVGCEAERVKAAECASELTSALRAGARQSGDILTDLSSLMNEFPD